MIATTTNRPILQVDDLHVHLHTDHGLVRAVDGVSFSIGAGESLGIVGESGCGKSMTALAIMALLPPRIGSFAGGRIDYKNDNGDSTDIVKLDPTGEAIRQIRGNEIAMVFQEPMTSLTPVHTIGDQIAEAILLHRDVTKVEARNHAIEMLERVQIPAARQSYYDYPHQLSGGMRQRVMIAMALSCNPRLLIADEPTTALDVTIQAQILALIKELQREFGMALLLITHDLGVVREVTERLSVFYLGKVVEEGDTAEVLSAPLHPYTKGLLQTIPRIGNRERLKPIPGTVPPAIGDRSGCGFAPRCELALERCAADAPPMFVTDGDRPVRCWLHKGADSPMKSG